MKSKQNGFTLIWLFIIIALIGLSVATAIPAYLDYLIRGQVAEGIRVASHVKTGVNDYWARHGTLPSNNEAARIAPAEHYYGNYTASVSVVHGQIVITYGNYANPSISDHVLTLTPIALNTGALSWVCGNNNEEFMDGVGNKKTDIYTKHIPSNCR